MPKMKPHRELTERVKQTGSRKLKRSHAYTSHRFHDKIQKQKHHLRESNTVHSTDYKRIKEILVK